MSQDTFTELEAVKQTQGAAATLDQLISKLEADKSYHQLFDALLMKKKFDLGLPLTQPTSFDDVPEASRSDFEKVYVDSARKVGEALLEQGQIAQAWIYLRTIREPQKIVAAIEALSPNGGVDEEILDIALYQGAAPAKGLELMIHSHGTCSSITALDQQFANLSPDVREKCAALLVNRLYEDLTQTLQHEVERKQPMSTPGQSLKELISGRDWLFADDNYHIDVSHLHAVIRFSRSLSSGAPELKRAIELSEYGSKLAEQYQYAGDPPFADYYPAHIQFFKALAGQGSDAPFEYFREQLGSDPNDPDSQLAALALIDLLTRLDRAGEAVELAETYLMGSQDRYGFSFADLCTRAGRFDALLKMAREKEDVIAFTAALLNEATPASST